MEGGLKPWRVQIITDGSPSLDSYGKPLPPPPSGYFWERQEDRSWELKSLKDKEDADFHMNFPNPSVLEHVVMPGDTIQGICLRYRVSAVELRRHNNFSGNNIQFSQSLRIPVEHSMPIRTQEDTPEVMLQRFKNITQEDGNEASYYLQESEYDLERALAAWKEDKDWNDTHFHSSNEVSSDLPLDESVHQDSSTIIPIRRGCFKNFMTSQKVQAETHQTTESWTMVNESSPMPLTANTGTEMSPPNYDSSLDDNSDIYVVPATTSWKYSEKVTSGSAKITDSILSIFGRKRSVSGNSGFSSSSSDGRDANSMTQPLIDEDSFVRPPSYPLRQIS